MEECKIRVREGRGEVTGGNREYRDSVNVCCTTIIKLYASARYIEGNTI